MNWVICPVRNNLHLTKKAIKTFRAQDVEGEVKILIINNQSTDGTQEWLASQKDLHTMHFNPPLSVAESWNRGLKEVFNNQDNDYCLVVNNDVELRPDTYRRLVDDGGLFVTAVGTRDPEKIKADYGSWPINKEPFPVYSTPDPNMKRPHPDMSCYLIRRETWERVGSFDENFKIAFCEDWDYHVRLHKSGITAYCIDLPFFHHGSMTIKNADPKEIKKIQVQGDLNRKYFTKKWGMVGASKEYYDFFGTTPPIVESTR